MLKQDRTIGNAAHVVVYGLFGIGNTGNDATLEVTLAELSQRLPGVRFTIVTSVPERVEAEFGAPSVAIRAEPRSNLPGPAGKLGREWGRWRDARALLRTADCLIVPGTGILDDFGVSVMEHAFQLWRWCEAARQVGTPVKFVSVGAGPAQRAWSRRLFRWAANAADHRSYRDEGSLRFARDVLGVDTARDRVTPDLVFGLDIGAPALTGEARAIGLGVIDYHSWHGSIGPDDAYGPYMDKMARFGCGLLQQGKAVRILVGDSGDAEAAQDLRDRLARGAPERADAIAMPETLTLLALCAEIANTDVVVATRYHTVIGALICGRPAVSIGYAAKNKAVMETFGMGGYCQGIGDYDLATLERHFAAASANLAETSERLRGVALSLRAEVREHFGRVADEIATSREATP